VPHLPVAEIPAGQVASDAMRGAIERQFGVRLSFQNAPGCRQPGALPAISHGTFTEETVSGLRSERMAMMAPMSVAAAATRMPRSAPPTKAVAASRSRAAPCDPPAWRAMTVAAPTDWRAAAAAGRPAAENPASRLA